MSRIPAPRDRHPHYLGLDVLRLLAAYLVLLNHFARFGWQGLSDSAKGDAAAFPWLEPFANVGAVGVEIFFVISGFVIAMSAVGETSAGFLRSRVTRILPALWVCSAISLGVRLQLDTESHSRLLSYFCKSILLSPAGPYIDGAIWTLVVEAAFYLLVGVSLRFGRHVSQERLAWGLGILSALFLTTFLCAMRGAPHGHLAQVADLLARFPFKVLLLQHGVFFAFGMLYWSVVQKGRSASRIAGMALFGLFGTCEICIHNDRATLSVPTDALWMVLVWLAGVTLLILSVTCSRKIHAVAHRHARLFGEMGRLSYPLYLGHFTLGIFLVPLLHQSGMGRAAALISALLIVSGIAWLVMKVPEPAIQRWLKSLLAARAPRDWAPRRMPVGAVGEGRS